MSVVTFINMDITTVPAGKLSVHK